MSKKQDDQPTQGTAPPESGENTAPDTVAEQATAPQGEAGEAQPVDLEAELSRAQAQATEYLDGWQRARAELDNYRKRMTREREEWQASIRGDLILGILPALDDFDLALTNLPEDIASHQWVNGILLAHRKMMGQLEGWGISEIEAVGKVFDPTLHEAVTHEPSADHQPGQVIAVVRKGYRQGDRVIRPALVRVAG